MTETYKDEKPRLLMGDDGWVVKSRHTESPKSLEIVFEVPKDKYKGSNTSENDILSRAKTTWLREHACSAWRTAIEREFGLVALEPDASDWVVNDTKPTDAEQGAYDEFIRMTGTLDKVKLRLSALENAIADGKKSKAKTKRNSDEWKRLDSELRALNERLKDAKHQVRLEGKLLTKAKNAWEKAKRRQDKRHAVADRKAYLKAKASLNESRLLFTGPVEVMVESNVVTGHVFDAPNCWPTVKPLQDGGTDTCVLWHDDNNKWIHKTTFYGGGKDPDCYVIRVLVREYAGDDNPFSDTDE